jgi:GMP synthase-like glutamine amidotransferase
MASCLVVQHVEPESPYLIGEVLADAGVVVDVRRVFAGASLPRDLADVDGLVVMGGPMSAANDEGFPTRRAELDLLTEGLDRGLPTLGVCLGAQLLALAGGGSVFPGAGGPEIGWGPVELIEGAGGDPLLAGLPDELTVLHWHGDTFDPPPGATLLASNSRYRSQAFRCGRRAWGLQFHLEVDIHAVEGFVSAFSGDLAHRPGSGAEILAGAAKAIEALEPARDLVFSRFAALVSAHATRTDLVGRP